MKNLLTASILASLLATSASYAQPVTTHKNQIQPDKGPYVGLQYVTIVGVGGVVGYQFNRYFAIEAEGSYANEFLLNVGTVGASAKIILPVSRRVNFYAKAGAVYETEHEDRIFDFDPSTPDTHQVLIALGAGMGVYATKHLEFTLEGNAGLVPKLHDRLKGGGDVRLGVNLHF